MKQFKANEKVLKIEIEEDSLNPRGSFEENIAIMALTHTRYDLGDEDINPETALNQLVIDKLTEFFVLDEQVTIKNLKQIMLKESFKKFENFSKYVNGLKDISEYFRDWAIFDLDSFVSELYINELSYILKDDIVIMPVSMYEHSGVTIYLGEVNQGFDTSSIGYIFVSKNDLAQHGFNVDNDTWKEKANEIIQNEFLDYSNYINDDIQEYCIRIFNENNEEIDIYNCYANYEEEAIQEYLGNNIKFEELIV